MNKIEFGNTNFQPYNMRDDKVKLIKKDIAEYRI